MVSSVHFWSPSSPPSLMPCERWQYQQTSMIRQKKLIPTNPPIRNTLGHWDIEQCLRALSLAHFHKKTRKVRKKLSKSHTPLPHRRVRYSCCWSTQDPHGSSGDSHWRDEGECLQVETSTVIRQDIGLKTGMRKLTPCLETVRDCWKKTAEVILFILHPLHWVWQRVSQAPLCHHLLLSITK